MVDKTITGIGTAVATPATTDLFEVEQAGTSKYMTLKQIRDFTGAVAYTATGSALGPTIADFFTATLSLEAASTYEVTALAYFLKSTAGTAVWTWTFSSAPIMASSWYRMTPVTGFTTTLVTGADLYQSATNEAATTIAHAATASLTTAVRHRSKFDVNIRTNAATTLQLRITSGAGTVTPQQGSYMRFQKVT